MSEFMFLVLLVESASPSNARCGGDRPKHPSRLETGNRRQGNWQKQGKISPNAALL